MKTDTLAFEIAGGALELVGPAQTIEKLRPYLTGFPLRQGSKPTRLVLREHPYRSQDPGAELIPEILITTEHTVLRQEELFELKLDHSTNEGTLDYIAYGKSSHQTPPQAPWLSLKTYYSLHALQHHGLLIHASALQLNSVGMFFAGVSGAGKSTIAGMFPPRHMLNDDIMTLFQKEGQLYLASTPFTSTVKIKRQHAMAKAQWGFGLEQSGTLKLRQLSSAEAFRLLLRSTITPKNQDLEVIAFQRSHAFSRQLKWRSISFPLQPSAVVKTITHLLNDDVTEPCTPQVLTQ
jgi:hypothetical protein